MATTVMYNGDMELNYDLDQLMAIFSKNDLKTLCPQSATGLTIKIKPDDIVRAVWDCIADSNLIDALGISFPQKKGQDA